jgi:hypothetical protein
VSPVLWIDELRSGTPGYAKMRIYLYMFLVVSSLTITSLRAGASDSSATDVCYCPQKSHGWFLYADQNRIPDFWWQDSVSVQEIILCPHGIHFLFHADQDDQPHYVALLVAQPTRELYKARCFSRLGVPSIESGLSLATERYTRLVNQIDDWSHGQLSATGRLDFTNSHSKPIIVPWRSLILRWGDHQTKLRGYLDVYMTVLA